MSTQLTIGLTLAAYFVFSAAAGAMSVPTKEQSTGWYGFLYRFIQRLAANADRVAEARFGSIVGPVGEAADDSHPGSNSINLTK